MARGVGGGVHVINRNGRTIETTGGRFGGGGSRDKPEWQNILEQLEKARVE
jgi:hypothetical protein